MIVYTEKRATETVPYGGLAASTAKGLYRATASYADACALVRACTVAHAVANGTHRAVPSDWFKSDWPDNLADMGF